VGLCEGACSGFLGKREMGGEWRTSDYESARFHQLSRPVTSEDLAHRLPS